MDECIIVESSSPTNEQNTLDANYIKRDSFNLANKYSPMRDHTYIYTLLHL